MISKATIVTVLRDAAMGYEWTAAVAHGQCRQEPSEGRDWRQCLNLRCVAAKCNIDDMRQTANNLEKTSVGKEEV